MAGPSRLAFTMPASATSLPYTLAAVLDAMRAWPPRRAFAAQDDPDRPSRGRLADVLSSSQSQRILGELKAARHGCARACTSGVPATLT